MDVKEDELAEAHAWVNAYGLNGPDFEGPANRMALVSERSRDNEASTWLSHVLMASKALLSPRGLLAAITVPTVSLSAWASIRSATASAVARAGFEPTMRTDTYSTSSALDLYRAVDVPEEVPAELNPAANR